MKIYKRHDWNADLRTASSIQKSLRYELKHCPLPQIPQTIASADISYSLHDNLLFAAVLLFDAVSMQCCRRYRIPEPIR